MTRSDPRLTLALQHHDSGALLEAEALYRAIVADDADQPDAWHLLGLLELETGRPEVAVATLSEAISWRPLIGEYHGSLGIAFKQLGRRDEAVACYERAIELDPEHAASHHNLGLALADLGRTEDAQACHRAAIRLVPSMAPAYASLGSILRECGHIEDSLDWARKGLSLRPDDPAALNELGITLVTAGRLDEAVATYRRALVLDPGRAAVVSNLGGALVDLGRLQEARETYEHALSIEPGLAAPWNGLGNALRELGDPDAAATCFERAVELDPSDEVAFQNGLACEHYRIGSTLESLRERHGQWDQRYGVISRLDAQSSELAPLTVSGHTMTPGETHRRPLPGFAPSGRSTLTLGFVSSDLRRHPVGHFTIRVLESLRELGHGIVIYSGSLREDDLTHRFRASAHQWRSTFGTCDNELLEAIRGDRLDVLFDLAGHTAGNRLKVFAARAASIQVAWAGYMGTTGLAAMDFLVADDRQVPVGSEHHYRERVLRMPNGYVCYDPPTEAPTVEPLPAGDSGPITFGSFNGPAKLSQPVLDLWARLLTQVPNSRLMLAYRGMDDPAIRCRIDRTFQRVGVGLDRLRLCGSRTQTGMLALYGSVDVALDTFPYGGGLTTCEALWMGVPVVTLPGTTFAGRHALSHLTSAGLTQTIARDEEHYVEVARRLAADRTGLKWLRARLRDQVARSPLCDGPRFARELVALLEPLVRPSSI